MQIDTLEPSRSSLTADSLILTELAAAPLAPAELKLRVKKRLGKVSAAALKVAIDQLLAAQRIHGRMKLGKGGKPTKTLESYALGAPPPPPPPPPPPEELARAEILKQLQRGSPSAKELKDRVRGSVAGLAAKAFDAVVAGLAAEKKLYVRYQQGKNGTPTKKVERYTLDGPSPAEFLGPVLSAWKLAKTAASAEGLGEQALVTALLSEFGLVAAAQGSSASERELLLRGLRDLVAREGSGSLIAMRKLRAAVPLSRSRFDEVLLALSAEDAVILHHHDYVASLSAEEREALVVDDYGNNYVGVAIRGGS